MSKKDFFVPENFLGQLATSDSPSGKYNLVIEAFSTRPGCWTYSRGVVKDVATGEVIAEVCRNYGQFPFAWVPHKNGNEYLVCGEDYQGQTLVNCTSRTVQSYLPEEAKMGHGFCWASIYPSPSGTRLVVDGCVWAGPFELIVVDFSNPDVMPWPSLEIEGNSFEPESEPEWIDEEHFRYRVAKEVRKSDKKGIRQLTDEELRAAEAIGDIEEVIETTNATIVAAN